MMLAPKTDDLWTRIKDCVFAITGDMKYGKVEIIIHEGRVIRLDLIEKSDKPPPEEVCVGVSQSADQQNFKATRRLNIGRKQLFTFNWSYF